MKTKQVSIRLFPLLIIILVIIAIIITAIVVLNRTGNEKKDEIIHQYAGSGTVDDPYRIEKVEDFIKLLRNIANGTTYKDTYFKLINRLDFQDDSSYLDINDTTYGDLNADGNIDGVKLELTTGNGFYGVIDEESSSFEGNFNGDNKTITNLIMNIPEGNTKTNIGLFENNKGTISNLRIIGNITTTNEYIENINMNIGMLASRNEGTIQSCRIEGNIKVLENAENANILIGGIVGENVGTILDSSSSVNIESNCQKAGITARNTVDSNILNSGVITNCSNNGEIKETSNSNNYTAGIVAENNGVLTSCTNNGKVEAKIAGRNCMFFIWKYSFLSKHSKS